MGGLIIYHSFSLGQQLWSLNFFLEIKQIYNILHLYFYKKYLITNILDLLTYCFMTIRISSQDGQFLSTNKLLTNYLFVIFDQLTMLTRGNYPYIMYKSENKNKWRHFKNKTKGPNHDIVDLCFSSDQTIWTPYLNPSIQIPQLDLIFWTLLFPTCFFL